MLLTLIRKVLSFTKRNPFEDSGMVFGRYYYCLMGWSNEHRGFDPGILQDPFKYSGVSAYNALTDADRPARISADIMTIGEHVEKPLKCVKVVFVVQETTCVVVGCGDAIFAKMGDDVPGTWLRTIKARE